MMKLWWLLCLLLAFGACESSSDVGLVTIEATGLVTGIGYIDDNGSQTFDAGDLPLDSVEIAIGFPGDLNNAFVTETDSMGLFTISNVLGGQYEVRFDVGELGDSLELIELTPLAFTLGAGDTIAVVLGAGYPPAPAGDHPSVSQRSIIP